MRASDLRTVPAGPFDEREIGLFQGIVEHLSPGISPEARSRSNIHPEDLLAAEHELVEGRIESFNTPYRVRHADGSWRWMVDRFRAAERDERGVATRLSGFAIDVTEDVQMRETLQASESALRQQQALQVQAQILETMSEAVLLVDRQHVAKMVKPAFEVLAGRRRAEMIGQPLTELRRDCVAEDADLNAAAVAHWRHHSFLVPLRRTCWPCTPTSPSGDRWSARSSTWCSGPSGGSARRARRTALRVVTGAGHLAGGIDAAIPHCAKAHRAQCRSRCR